jgi:two-component system chemotaxis sensor kinase CheA
MTEPDAEFLVIFQDEANERLDNIVDTLLALEARRAAPDAIDALFRDAHTIKGAAGMLGLDDVRALAHSMEDVLAGVRESGTFPAELVEPLLRAADALRSHVAGTGASSADLLDELALRRADLLGGHEPSGEPDEVDEPEGPVEPAPAGGPERRTIRVAAEKLDRLLDLVGETVLHRRRLEHQLGVRAHESEALADELGLGDRLLDDLKDATIQMRTLPLESITGSLPRAVRDIAADAGKDVELVITGADTELDRVILAGLSEPLVHLLRNAVGHGIEAPAEREAAGKPRAGRVELRAEQKGGTVEITVTDDGRGVSAEALERAAREGGSLTDVLARAGFSTAGEVTELSGRGVGLDAVKTQVETFGGSVEVRSEPGLGTAVVLRLPLALALLEVLLVERGAQVYGVPLGSVEEAVSVDGTLMLSGLPAIELRGRSLPLADLASLVGGEGSPPEPDAPALVIAAGGRRVAAVCDTLLGQEEVVVKPLGPLLATVSGYLGAAILGDGRIALLLDPSSLVREPGKAARKTRPETAPSPSEGKSVAPKVLVVEDSFTVRELQRSILEAAGYRVETARDGREALDRLSRDLEIGIVVTDIEMPEMDGIELTEAIRADPQRSSLPVVIVTSHGSEEDRKRGLEAGADAYMAKRSFDQRALLETVEQLVGR